jgi:hypothetical protein
MVVMEDTGGHGSVFSRRGDDARRTKMRAHGTRYVSPSQCALVLKRAVNCCILCETVRMKDHGPSLKSLPNPTHESSMAV